MAISNSDDVIDSRDVIKRIVELEGEREAHNENRESDNPWADEYPDESDELTALVALASEAEGCAADWNYGEALIRRSYFVNYACELADDMNDRPSTGWPYRHIDWDAAAQELEQDYTTVDFDGVEYLIR